MASTILLTDVKVLADELVCCRHATAPRLEALSLLDQAETANGSRGFQLLLKSSVAAPVLKTALAETLSNCPSFAGRLVQGKSGTFDVSCCNSGARLVIAATSASLRQAEAAVGHAPVQAEPLNPWAAFALPTSPDHICRNQAFAAHLSATYSTATHIREIQAPGAASVTAAAAARMVEVAASGADGAGGSSRSSSSATKHDSHCGSDAVSRTGSHCSMDSARSVCSSIGIAPFAHASGMAASSAAAGLAAPCALCGGGPAAAGVAGAAAAAAATTTSAPISISARVSSSSQLRTLSSHPFTFEEITWEEEEQEEEDGGAVAGDSDTAATAATAASGSPPPPRRSASAAARKATAAAASSVVSACCAACRSTYTAATAAAAAASPIRLATALAAAAEQLPSPFAAQRASAAAAAAATAVAKQPARAAFRADAVEALAVEGPLPQGVPERPDRLLLAAAAAPLVAGGRWATWALLAARSLIYTDILGQGCELHLPTARLAELKSQATAELAQEKEWEESHAAAHAAAAAGGNDNAACCGCAWHGPALRDVQWVSSNDVLCARLMQLLHSTPLRQMWPSMTLLRPADLRRRRLGGLSGQQSLSGLLPAETAAASASAAAAADPLVLGNASYAARMQAAAPSRQSLGRLAGQLRQSLGYVVPQLSRSLAQARAALQQVQAQAGAALLLLPGSAAASHPQECGQSPAGPLTVAALDVRPDLLTFGPERPVAVLPLDGTVAPNTVLAYPAIASTAAPGAAAGSSTCLAAALHRVTWRQLDAMYGKDLAAAF
eukprot:XP_001702723.1 acetyltransferase [Chlamydomonas reinhardtii]